MTCGGDLAFPSTEDCEDAGLSKREYFASQIMSGLASMYPGTSEEPGRAAEAAIANYALAKAQFAVQCADALIAALNRPIEVK